MIKYHKFLESDQFELTELNTPVNPAQVHARYTAGGAAATYQFPLSTERGRRDGINPSYGDNVATAEVATTKWWSENVVESEVDRSETLFLRYRKGVGKQLVQPPFLF